MTMFTNIGKVEVTEAQVLSTLRRAAMMTGSPLRADSSGVLAYPEGMIEDYRARCDAASLSTMVANNPGWKPDRELLERRDAWRQRNDAAFQAGPAAFARDFDFIHQEILEEARPQLNAMRLFPDDASVPLGWPRHVVRRSVVSGRARWHHMGDSFPIAKAGYLEETFNTGFVVCAVQQSYFEGLTLGVSGLQTYRIEADGCLRALDEFLNEVAWYGDKAKNIYGVLTYPGMATMTLGTALVAASTGPTIVNALHTALSYPITRSNGVFRPNVIVTSPEVDRFLSMQAFDSSGGIVSVKEYLMKGLPGVRWEVAHEVSAAEMTAHGVGNPAGYHGILAYYDDRRSVAHVLPQTPTFLPIWRSSPIDELHVAFASTGGIVQRDLGNQILIFVRLTA